MKKLLFLSATMAIAVSGMAQRNKVGAARDAYVDNEMMRARQNIDEAVVNPETKESAEAWLLRANIYSKINETPSLVETVPDAIYTSNASLLHAIELNPRYDKEGADLAVERSMSYLLNKGINFYRDKKYDSAISVFTNVRAFLTAVGGANRFNDNPERRKKLAGISRRARQLLGYSAYENGDYATAVATLEDLRKGAKDMDPKMLQDIYTYLILAYGNQKNQEKYAELLKEAATKYPDDARLQDLRLNLAIQTNETTDVIAGLEKNPRLAKSADMQYALASTYYRIATAEGRSTNADTLAMAEQHLQKAEAGYRAGLALQDRADLNLGLGLLFYNRANALILKMTSLSSSAADNQKYEEYKRQSRELMSEAIPHFEKAATEYEAIGVKELKSNAEYDAQRRAYRSTLEGLREMYGRLENKEKRKETDERLKALTGGA